MIQFINIKNNDVISRFHKINFNISFTIGEEIIIKGMYYKFIKKCTSFYEDADGEQILISIYLDN